MKYINKNSRPTYCSACKCTLNPGCISSDSNELYDFLMGLLKKKGSFLIRLSKKDLDALNELRKADEAAKSFNPNSVANKKDPLGLKAMDAKRDEEKKIKDAEWDKKITETRETERRINRESIVNMPNKDPLSVRVEALSAPKTVNGVPASLADALALNKIEDLKKKTDGKVVLPKSSPVLTKEEKKNAAETMFKGLL